MTRKNQQGKKGKYSSKKIPMPNIPEDSGIRITQILEEFRDGPEQVHKFEGDLTKTERAAVHALCQRMGMLSKSTGSASQRRVSVYKPKNTRQGTTNEEKTVTQLSFSEETKIVLLELFTRYPPENGEKSEEMSLNHIKDTHNTNDESFSKRSMSKVEISKKVASLASRMKSTPQLRQILEVKSKLPITSFKDSITSTLESHQVALICGETGCGKTTQVPQFLLDHMWSKGEACKIVCTQPRRISATSVAERISYERGEKVGDSVGYKIRLEAKGGKHSSIMFCTNGVLLRVLVGNGTGKHNPKDTTESPNSSSFSITHIIVDEIHERDRFSDIMLAILRDMLPSFPYLRLILMSATIDAERFSQYFGGCPVIRVPGFTYPVKTFYLDDVLSIFKSENNSIPDLTPGIAQDAELTEDYRSALDEAINLAWSSDEFAPLVELVSSEATEKIFNYQHSLTGVSPLMVFAGKGRVGDVCMLLSFGSDCHLRAKDGTTALEWAEKENQVVVVEIIKQHIGPCISKSEEEKGLVERYLASVSPEHIDISLIVRLVRKICTESKEGAILVFLPGWDDINRTRESLTTSQFFRDPKKFLVIALHSMVPSEEQRKVFQHPPYGSRKIILSTNMAETAVTIDDVVYVIDSGRMKEKSYDPYSNISTLQSSWVSKASAKQRAGRAGRCQPGICYHLYSKARAASLPDFQVPEIKRMPIEELCLQVKMLDPSCKIAEFLQKMLDPPVVETIRNAVVLLQEIGALSLDERLTELGRKLGSLPVHPSTSKMLFFATLMNCLDPALTLACAYDFKDPFILPMAPDEKKKATSAKAEFALLCGGLSDQLIIISAFECWRRAKDRGEEARFCSQYFLSPGTMRMLDSLRNKLQNELIKIGFIPKDVSSCSLNAKNPGILHAVLVAGLYPMVGRTLPPRNGREAVETASGAKVRIHPHSSTKLKLSSDKLNSTSLVVYDEITRGDGGIHIRNCTVVGPYPLVLLATEMVVAPSKGNEDDEENGCVSSGEDDEMEVPNELAGRLGEEIMSSPDNTVSVVVDRWLTFESTALDAAQIYCLRERLHAAILFKVKFPTMDLPPYLGASVYAVACLLWYQGMSGISPAFKSDVKDDNSNSFLKSLMSDNITNNSSHSHYPRQQQRASNSAFKRKRGSCPR